MINPKLHHPPRRPFGEEIRAPRRIEAKANFPPWGDRHSTTQFQRPPESALARKCISKVSVRPCGHSPLGTSWGAERVEKTPLDSVWPSTRPRPRPPTSFGPTLGRSNNLPRKSTSAGSASCGPHHMILAVYQSVLFRTWWPVPFRLPTPGAGSAACINHFTHLIPWPCWPSIKSITLTLETNGFGNYSVAVHTPRKAPHGCF